MVEKCPESDVALVSIDPDSAHTLTEVADKLDCYLQGLLPPPTPPSTAWDFLRAVYPRARRPLAERQVGPHGLGECSTGRPTHPAIKVNLQSFGRSRLTHSPVLSPSLPLPPSPLPPPVKHTHTLASFLLGRYYRTG